MSRKKYDGVLRQVAAAAEKQGMELKRVSSGRLSHHKYHIVDPVTGETRCLVCSKTPSDHRSEKNFLCQARRLVRELKEARS